MLPFFTALPSMQLEELRRALEMLVATHFPMQSDEFPRGSLQCNNYMDCIRKVRCLNWIFIFSILNLSFQRWPYLFKKYYLM